MKEQELQAALRQIKEFGAWDKHFRLYSIRFFGDSFDWTRFKCQCWRESAFKAEAVSSCGARGAMQIMPATWAKDLEPDYGIHDPWNPEHSIFFGIAYMRRLWTVWTKDHRNDGWPEDKVWQYALASYNDGRGNISKALRASIRAQQAAGIHRPDTAWEKTVEFVDLKPGIEEADERQVRRYVEDITQLSNSLGRV